MAAAQVSPNKTSSATIRDVAKRAGVSVATVSRVLNNTSTVSPDTYVRVQATISELNFVPRAAAQSLSKQKTNLIGLMMTEIGWDNFFPPMLRGIEAACYESGFDLLIHSTHLSGASLRPPLGEHNTDGLLIFLNPLPDSEIARLHNKGFSIVLLHRSPPDALPIPHIVFENKASARLMTNHLIETHSCRRIAFLSGPADNEDSYWRELGYRESLAAHGLPVDPALIRLGGFAEEVGQRTVEDWLKEGFNADAIFAADDDSAYGAVRALQNAGKRVPEDVPVVGFDDSPVSRLLSPPLTTVCAPIEEAGYKAGQILAGLIHTGQATLKELLPTELVIRRSCGCNG
jgi:LacI family transcriptional regulator